MKAAQTTQFERQLPLYPQLKMLQDPEQNWILSLGCIYCSGRAAFFQRCGRVCVGRGSTGAFHFKGKERLLCIIRRTSLLCSLTHLPLGIKARSGSALGLSRSRNPWVEAGQGSGVTWGQSEGEMGRKGQQSLTAEGHRGTNCSKTKPPEVQETLPCH